MTLRHPPAPDRIVADFPIDKREAFLIEKLDTGKVIFWVCSRTPHGRTVFASARRTSAVPRHLLGHVWPVLRRLDTNAQPSAPSIRRVS